jgi:hypothetical protein
MTRNGKIARLPGNIRDELNTRLDLGEDGPALLDWLNAEPEVQECLKNLFQGVPISKQNLSEWRLGGYREWQLREEWIDHAYELERNVNELGARVEAPLLAGQLAAMLAARYAALINTWDGEPDPVFEQKLRLLRGLNRDVAMLQRTLLQAGRHERENLAALEAEQQKTDQRHKDRMSAPVLAKVERAAMAATMGGDEDAWKMATVLTDAKYDLRQGQPMVKAKPAKKDEGDVNKDHTNGSQNGEAKKPEPTLSILSTPSATPKSESVKASQTHCCPAKEVFKVCNHLKTVNLQQK